MGPVQFEHLDLNLLRVFDALIEERSVTKAGERLGLTASAVSHALNRLRLALKDDLFVRGPNGMQPTLRAADIGPRLHQTLLQLRAALAPAEFFPAEAEREFTIASSDYGILVLLPAVMAIIRREAPHVGLRVWPLGEGTSENLDSGRVDLAIGAFGKVPERFDSLTLFSEVMVWVIRADHPSAAGPLTLERLVELPHLIPAMGPQESAVGGIVVEHGLERYVSRDESSELKEALAARGIRRMIAMTVPNVLAVPSIVEQSDMAALIPRRVALSAANRYRLKFFEPPYAPAAYDYSMIWHKTQGVEPGNAWLRGVFREAAAAL